MLNCISIASIELMIGNSEHLRLVVYILVASVILFQHEYTSVHNIIRISEQQFQHNHSNTTDSIIGIRITACYIAWL